MNTALRARPEVLAGGDLATEPARVRTLVLAVATTLSLAVLSAAAARFDGWAVEPPMVAAAPARVAAAPVAVRPVGVPAIPAHDHLDALARLVAKKYRVSTHAARDLIATAFREGAHIGVDPLLVIAVMAVESRFNPIAESDAGAMGLMQVIPAFHQDKLDASAGDPVLDPHANIRLGARVLGEYIKRGGSETAGLQMYNGSGDDPSNGYANKVFAERTRLQQAVARLRDRSRA